MTGSGGIDVSTKTALFSAAAGVGSWVEAANASDVSAKMVRYHEKTGVLRTAGRPGRWRGQVTSGTQVVGLTAQSHLAFRR